MKKIILVLALVLLMAGFFIFDLHQLLTLDGIKGSLDKIESWQAEAPLLTAGFYFGIYILVTALSLPGAAIMTLAGGALFGLGWGLLLVSFASSIGALLAFLVSRYVLRDWVQSRFGERLKPLMRELKKRAPFISSP